MLDHNLRQENANNEIKHEPSLQTTGEQNNVFMQTS